MPYISKEQREYIDGRGDPLSPGQLNYAISDTVKRFLSHAGHNYTSYNAVVGALESAKLELYRRLIAPYEDRKIEEHGDIF